MTGTICPQQKIEALLALAGGARRSAQLDNLLASHPHDARLHFLKGSWLAGNEDFDGARAAMRQAVQLAPHYAIARFQLGLLYLSSGDPIAAQETWGPLHGLDKDNFLRAFVDGLTHLIHDEFDAATARLKDGISTNRENTPMNGDMQLIIDAIAEKMGPAGRKSVSGVDFLLRQSGLAKK